MYESIAVSAIQKLTGSGFEYIEPILLKLFGYRPGDPQTDEDGRIIATAKESDKEIPTG